MTLTIGSRQFGTQLLMPHNQSDQFPDGTTMVLTPQDRHLDFGAFVQQNIDEIMSTTHQWMSLVFQLEQAFDLAQPASPRVRDMGGITVADDTGQRFHTDGNGVDPKRHMVTMLTPMSKSRFDIDRPPTYVARAFDVLGAMNEMIDQDFPDNSFVSESAAHHYAEFKKYLSDIESPHTWFVQVMLQSASQKVQNGIPGTKQRLPELLRQRGQLHAHDWRVQKGRTVLAMANTPKSAPEFETHLQTKNEGLLALHARAPGSFRGGSSEWLRSISLSG